MVSGEGREDCPGLATGKRNDLRPQARIIHIQQRLKRASGIMVALGETSLAILTNICSLMATISAAAAP